jgi:FMN reductase
LIAKAVGIRLGANGIRTATTSLGDVPAEDLVGGRWDSHAARAWGAKVAQADAVVIATPVYKASFSGGLKALLDLLPERALADKIVLPIASGGTLAHLLAVEYALKPVLSVLGARHILSGVFAHEAQVSFVGDGPCVFDAEVQSRIEESVEQLTELLEHADARRLLTSEPLAAISQRARCSA